MTGGLFRGILLLLVLLSAGCGYRFSDGGYALPEGVDSLHVELFANQTVEPLLENFITEQVTSQFLLKSGRTLTPTAERADTILSGTVLSYQSKPVSYDRNDEITEYQSKMTLSVQLRDRLTGKVLWKGNLKWDEEYPASNDKTIQEDNEEAAIRLISQRLADEIFTKITENF